MRLMVLGGGNCQQNLIKRAKDAGHYVVVADYLPDCPGRLFADAHAHVSTFDTDSVIKAARMHRIDAIVTLGTDQPVLTAAIAAETLGLPFYADAKTAKAVTNKRIMKKIFHYHSIPSVNSRLIGADFSDADIKGLRFPAVLKPVDSQGQRGIYRVDNINDMRQKIGETLSYSREDKVLLEEYYENDEITVNGWAEDGKCTIISVVDRVTITNTSHIGICLCHNFPSVHLKTYDDEITSLTQRIVSAFGIKNGPIYFQYLIGEDGIKVNEIAMRIGGAYEDITIPILSGIDIVAMLLEYIEKGICDTRPLKNYSLKDNAKHLSTQLFFCTPGTIASITPKDEILSLPYVHDFYCAYSGGDTIPHIENATARAGYIIIEGTSFNDMIANVNAVFDQLQVLDETGSNLVIKYKGYKNKYVFADIE